jgi:hypothetical protein
MQSTTPSRRESQTQVILMYGLRTSLSLSKKCQVWITAYRVSARVELREGTLSFRTVANDLREEIRRRNKASKSSNLRIARGAFGPYISRPSEESLDNRGERETSARPDDESQDTGIPESVSQKKRKGASTGGSSRRRKFQACAQLHPLTRCFYIFPDQAESWWEKNEEIPKKVEKALKSDQKLIEEVDKVKKNSVKDDE